MSDRTSNRFAILGMLAAGPMSGYDIRRAISNSLVHFWNISFGSIYPILADLERQGLAEKAVVPQDGKPDRHLYTITASGRAALMDWIARPAATHQERIETLLKVILGGYAPAAVTRSHLDRYHQEHRAKQEQYLMIKKHLQEEHAGNEHLPFWMMTLDCGIAASAAMLDWSAKALVELDRLEKSGAINPNGAFGRGGLACEENKR